ncbi:hypothetical protein MTP99_005392 [Tenebrio molitor]|nr:hypothetical protein MTP99_005392 [Tenebrio molitor]
MKTKFVLAIVFIVCVFDSTCGATESNELDSKSEIQGFGRQLVEQGRTMVHHAVKRFLIILPAIFFKLGIAFTLLIVVALAAVNNGFIGFLLLVVGLSSVLARLQDTRGAAIPYVSPLPPYHQHVWDRSDSSVVDRSDNTKAAYYAGYVGQNQQYNPALTNYYSKYTTSKV